MGAEDQAALNEESEGIADYYAETDEKPLHTWQQTDYGDIDEFIFEINEHPYCHGPACLVCGKIVCMHCYPEIMTETCPGEDGD